MKSWKKESDWKPYFKNMSNKELTQTIREQKKNHTRYRGTVLPKVARDELARRKASGKIRKNAGTKKKSYSLYSWRF